MDRQHLALLVKDVVASDEEVPLQKPNALRRLVQESLDDIRVVVDGPHAKLLDLGLFFLVITSGFATSALAILVILDAGPHLLTLLPSVDLVLELILAFHEHVSLRDEKVFLGRHNLILLHDLVAKLTSLGSLERSQCSDPVVSLRFAGRPKDVDLASVEDGERMVVFVDQLNFGPIDDKLVPLRDRQSIINLEHRDEFHVHDLFFVTHCAELFLDSVAPIVCGLELQRAEAALLIKLVELTLHSAFVHLKLAL